MTQPNGEEQKKKKERKEGRRRRKGRKKENEGKYEKSAQVVRGQTPSSTNKIMVNRDNS